MGYKMIRIVGFLSALMMLLLLGATLWEALSGARSAAPKSTQGLWMAFFFLSLLATRVVSILEIQADEIAHLKRRLAERPSGG
jgi:hypothetical protein